MHWTFHFMSFCNSDVEQACVQAVPVKESLLLSILFCLFLGLSQSWSMDDTSITQYQWEREGKKDCFLYGFTKSELSDFTMSSCLAKADRAPEKGHSVRRL